MLSPFPYLQKLPVHDVFPRVHFTNPSGILGLPFFGMCRGEGTARNESPSN